MDESQHQDQTEHQAHAAEAKPKSRKLKLSKKTKKVIGAIVLAAVVAAAIFFGMRYNKAQNEIKRLSNPQEAARTETEILVDRVSKLAAVPDETPQVATVSDASKLKGQSFFKNAANGDKVLIFTKAKKAILYRPSTNKIIEIAPVNIGNNQKQPAK